MKNKEFRYVEWFGGIGAATQAIKKTFKNEKLIDYVELDKHAVKSFNALNDTNFVPTDINDVDVNNYGELDLLIAGFPCQDISTAGKGKGFEKGTGTRSGLIWMTLEKLHLMKDKPKYILLENVKGLISKRFKETYDIMVQEFEYLGYDWNQVLLNAKNFGVAQSRDRVYMLLNRKDYPKVDITSLLDLNTTSVVLKDILDYSIPTNQIILNKCGQSKNFISLPSKTGNITNCSFNRAWKDDGTVGTLSTFAINSICYLADLFDQKQVIWKEDIPYFQLSDGSLRKLMVVKGDNKTVNVPFGKNFTSNVTCTTDGVSKTIMTNSPPRVILDENIDQKLNNMIYFKNEMSQYNGKIIKLDINKLENQDPTKINKIATLGTLEKEEYVPIESKIIFKDHSYNSTKSFLGTKGVSKTITTEAYKGYAPKVMFKKVSFVQDSTYLGVDGLTSTLVSQSPGYKNKTMWEKDSVIHYRKLSTAECWILMGFTKSDHNKCQNAGVSNSQLAKQAGNSIVVNVIESLLKKLLIGQKWAKI